MAYGACLHKTGYENILSIEQFWPRLQVALHPYLSYLALTLHSDAKYDNLVHQGMIIDQTESNAKFVGSSKQIHKTKEIVIHE